MNGKANLNIRLLVWVLVLLLAGRAAVGGTIHVPADFNSIQAAIDAAANYVDEIEVAPGTYNETINFNDKEVRLYSSSGPDVTIIDANGIVGAYHVVQCVNNEGPNTILEGFTITGGDANSSNPDDRGGGMYNFYSSPTVTNCIFSGNSAAFKGGGMFNDNSSPMVTDCNFTGNSAISGGGMHTDWSNPTVTNCTFSGNSATYGGGMNNNVCSPTVTDCNFTGNSAIYGGGMHNNQSTPTVSNCTFSGNSADYGGGMSNNVCSPTVTDCNFSGNSASTFGGGMFNTNSSNPTVTNCSFSQNTTATNGGGMWNGSSSNPTVSNCSFSGNTATGKGGGMFNDGCSPTITNCTFSSNTADGSGGAMRNWSSSPTVTNCTFSGNTAVDYGGGMFNENNSTPTVTNCILWGDTPDEIYDDSTSSTIIYYSNVQDGWPGPPPPGNIDADPWFVDAAGGDLRLSSSASPCVDAGDNSTPGLPATDLAGNPRIVDGDWNGTATVDMGAYEFQSWLIHNITRGRWYETIQTAIDDANDYDEIEVAPGTYYEAINFNGRAVRLYSSGGPDVTTIDANGIAGAYHVVQCISGEDANTILEGFTIKGGDANGSYPDSGGGGMLNYNNSSPTVTNCTFRDNAARHGGGMANRANSSPMVTNCIFSGNTANEGGGMDNFNNSSPTVTNCTFRDNTVSWFGGGMRNYTNSSPTVTNCNFRGNTAVSGGGMANHTNSSSTVTNCIFSGNQATIGNGGGMYNYDNSPTVTNCTFSGNSSDEGGGIYNYNSSPTVTNCTFSGNTAVNHGGGMFNGNNSSPMVTNCILWGDEPNEIDNDVTSSAAVVFSDVQGGWPDANNTNIDADPLFVDANNPDPNLRSLRLKPDSPCIDAGDSTVLLAMEVYLDLDGEDRYVDIDAVADTGVGSVEFLDMGAYEFNCSGIPGDINCDGVVNFKDVAILANNWLAKK